MGLLQMTFPLLGGLGVLLMWWSLMTRQRSVRRAQPTDLLDGIQVRLKQAKLEAKAGEFLSRGALLGGLMGAAGSLIIGTWVVFPVFFLGGYVFLWTRLEDERNQKINQYNKDLAWAMDIILNSWRIRPSMGRALQAVGEYGPGSETLKAARTKGTVPPTSVAADFDEVVFQTRQGKPLAQSLQTVADRRQNLTFDSLATALIVADEQSGEVAKMLQAQAEATREQAKAFDQAIAQQRGGRTEIRYGTFGPWAILVLARGASMVMGAGTYDTEFFHTLTGQIVALASALVTIGVYTAGMWIAARGLVLNRVETES